METGKQERHYILQIIEEERQRWNQPTESASAALEALSNIESKIRQHERDYESPKPRDPLAKTMADLVTPRQLVAIRTISNVQKVNAEMECFDQLKCSPEELSRRAASWFIDHLKQINHDQQTTRLAG